MGDLSFYTDSYSLRLDFIHPLSDAQRCGEIMDNNDRLWIGLAFHYYFAFYLVYGGPFKVSDSLGVDAAKQNNRTS